MKWLRRDRSKHPQEELDLLIELRTTTRILELQTKELRHAIDDLKEMSHASQ